MQIGKNDMFEKNISRRTALKYAGSTFIGLAAPALISSNAQARTLKGISYGENKLDIYQPGNALNAPIIAFVHGGAWKAGRRSSVGAKAKYFTRKGFVFASIGYTLYPSANAERQALQVAQGVNWIAKNAANFGGNPNRIALMGHSAGCHLASLASLSGATKAPRALICNDTGAYDLNYLAQLNNGRLPSLFSALNKPNKWTKWSPISYVANRSQPPSLVIWSGGRNRDKIGQNFANALQRAGNSVTRFDGGRYNHLSINSSIGKQSTVTSAVDAFLTRTV